MTRFNDGFRFAFHFESLCWRKQMYRPIIPSSATEEEADRFFAALDAMNPNDEITVLRELVRDYADHRGVDGGPCPATWVDEDIKGPCTCGYEARVPKELRS